ncbi:hypothetical protein AX15_004581 [Amanita polypyramis BW_CC]|nr:hypothetical protein AX15_004581 [Amanita polypyramis BW_CC]
MNGKPFSAVAGPSNSHNHAPLAPSSSNFSMSTPSPPSTTPSTRPPPAPSIPSLYLPPPGPPPPQTLLASTQDLISRLNLLSAYDKYVRPTIVSPNVPAPEVVVQDQAVHPTQGLLPSVPCAIPGVVGVADKGKGKEKDVVMDGPAGAGVPLTGGPGVAGGADEDAGKGEKKRKNTYKHLIKGIPGKHSMKKDDYISTTMLVPPKQRIPIVAFDARTQRDAFTISLEGLKGWNIHALVLESPQAREDRKKRKELKRLAKAQAATLAVARQTGAQAQDQAAITAQTRPQAAVGAGPNHTGTPRPTARPSTTTATGLPTAMPTPVKADPQTAHPQASVPRSGSAVPRPKSTVPRPGSTKPSTAGGQTVAPAAMKSGSSVPISGTTNAGAPLRSGTPMQVDQQRGIKREREENMANGTTGSGHGLVSAGTPTTIIDTGKAGITGVRPRPIKKQRMDMQGQARDVVSPVQQPTPQGV